MKVKKLKKGETPVKKSDLVAGQVRLVKCDERNYGIEKVVVVTNRVTKEDRLEWAEVGYFGHRLDWAVESALMASLPEGKELYGEFQKAADRILKEMREIFKEKK